MPLHPQLAAIVQAAAHLPKPYQVPIAIARAGFRRRIDLLPKAHETLGSVHDFSVLGTSVEIPVRWYSPPQEALGLLIFFHGGGFVIGDLDTHDGFCRRLCARLSCAVLSVDYRLAPEHPYPAAPEDCWTVVRWAAANVSWLSSGAPGLLLAGDSAGGALAAATAMRCRDEGIAIRAQALIYPTLDHYSREYGSYAEMGGGYGLTRDSMRWFWDQYLPNASSSIDAYAAPMRAQKLAGLPPTLVITAEYDVLRDEGEAYAQALSAAGVAARASRYPGMNHGFAALSGIIDDADRAIAEICAWLRARLAT